MSDTDLWGPDGIADAGAGQDRPDLAAERIIAASVMARPALIDELAGEFDPADILADQLRWVWNAVDEIRETLTKGEIRWEAVHRQLQTWRATGYMPVPPMDVSHLSSLYDEAQTSYAGAAYYARQITEAAINRRFLALSHDMNIRGRSAAFDSTADIPAIQDALDDLVRNREASAPKALRDIIGGALERSVTKPNKNDRVPTGFADLDMLLQGGFKPGQLVVVAARPAMGKSTFGLGLARAAAIRHATPTLFESLEMGEEELGDNILAAESRVALHHIKTGSVDDAGVAREARAAQRITDAPLYLNDSAELSLPILRGRVRHMIRTVGLRLVIVDYLQLMDAPKAENRQAEVSKLTRGLKLMAKEFGITLVILAQLNRGPEQRTDKKPLVSDLRESGAIEQDADIVILLHREDAYDKESPRAGEADVIVGKHRAGPTATITTAFQGHYAQFVDMAVS
ncbi:replicative DNA helicase [Streptomyces showdoensis]|uniref:DNA helicase n=1 Tax=Streptomyces showdoensis TaxID=68268 RepID=A0A2P2GTQ6_STREW|nr:replicative DNA helicase [Streptomyces showdoensis]KKZ74876.1 DNA helicase [Streptomyces showdoensis]